MWNTIFLASQTIDSSLYGVAVGIVAIFAILLFFLQQAVDIIARLPKVFGWTCETPWVFGAWARWARRRRLQEHFDILHELGVDGLVVQELRRALLTIGSKRNSSGNHSDRPDLELFTALRPWIRELEGEYSYPETGRLYVDTMGAIHYGTDGTEPLTRILEKWIRVLLQERTIDPFDCVITNKLGNVEIAEGVCTHLSGANVGNWPKAIRWKPEGADNSRVTRGTNSPPHISDFEGLSAFLAKNKDRIKEGRPFRAIGLDDNVTDGASLGKAILEFNRLIEQDSLPFMCVDTVVALFRVKKPSGAETYLEKHGLNLHALLSLGHDEMEELKKTKPGHKLNKNIQSFKQGFGCDVSRGLSEVKNDIISYSTSGGNSENNEDGSLATDQT